MVRKLATKPEIAKGDYVSIENDFLLPSFLGVCLDNYRNRPIRMCDVYGLFHEAGSVYAYQLSKLDVNKAQFKEYLSSLHQNIIKHTGRTPDWTPEDFERDYLLKNVK
jgi:hypothetical protein